ncbi:AfsR/SARP family transcriptional regulator [Sphaerimonospora mesophila]|uniref:AfsR/SARP family transcriptional regulator n=1 Tax=Sphaerimonospora mesophila TaxID=37483 RepID=UPI001365538A
MSILQGNNATPLRSAPVRGLAAIFMLAENRVLSIHELLTSMQNEPTDHAASNLRRYISQLRDQLGSLRDRLITLRGGGGGWGGGYQLIIKEGELDIEIYRRLAQQGETLLRRGQSFDALATLTHAYTMWRGPIGRDCTASELLRAKFEAINEFHVRLRELRAEAAIEMSVTAELILELRQLVAEVPLRESAWVLLIRALFLGGSVSDALIAFSDVRRILVEQLGIEPSARLQELHQAILTRDETGIRTFRFHPLTH